MKTAISIPDDIFKDIEKLSKELHCSRSRLIADAAKEYIEKIKNKKILDALDDAYSESETKEEAELRRESKKKYGKRLQVEKW